MAERQRDGGQKVLSFSRIAYSLPAARFSLFTRCPPASPRAGTPRLQRADDSPKVTRYPLLATRFSWAGSWWGLAWPPLTEASTDPSRVAAHIQDGDDPHPGFGDIVVGREREAPAEQAEESVNSPVNACVETQGGEISQYAFDEIIPHPIFLGIVEGFALLEVIHGFGQKMHLAQFHSRENFARTSASECSTDFPELRRRRRSLRTRRCQAGEGITESCACNEAQRFSIAANRSGRLIFSISVGVIGAGFGGRGR